MALNYTTYTAQLSNILPIPLTDPNFQAVIPSIIDDAEQRLYRELDLLNNIIRNIAGNLTPGSRNFTFPQWIIVSESINIFDTPGITNTGRRQLIPVSREWMDAVWPDETAFTGECQGMLPHYYAMITDQQIIVGPPPSLPYQVEVIGTIRPSPISATNPTTYLSTYLPDLFLAESLIFGFAYMKDFGAAVDDPKSSATWSSHYQDLWQSAQVEEQRKRYASQAWTPKMPAAIATPSRV